MNVLTRRVNPHQHAQKVNGWQRCPEEMVILVHAAHDSLVSTVSLCVLLLCRQGDEDVLERVSGLSGVSAMCQVPRPTQNTASFRVSV